MADPPASRRPSVSIKRDFDPDSGGGHLTAGARDVWWDADVLKIFQTGRALHETTIPCLDDRRHLGVSRLACNSSRIAFERCCSTFILCGLDGAHAAEHADP